MPFDASSEIHDDALMVLYANGDGEAARILAARHTKRVLALAYRMLQNQAAAEDVAQEAMIRLWKIAPEWRRGEAKVSTWLYRIASNLCLDQLRKKRGAALDDIAEPEDDAASVEEVMLHKTRVATLNEAMNELPERQKLAVTLRHLDEMANPEIAEIMDISVEAVESLTSRGKRTLRALLQGQEAKIGYGT